MSTYKVEDAFAGTGVHKMTYQGYVEFTNQFGRVCHEHRFRDVANGTQAICKTGTRFLPDTELSKLMTSMFGTTFATDEVVNPGELVGQNFSVTIQEVNGFGKVTNVAPISMGGE
jgi:hypothetical protein